MKKTIFAALVLSAAVAGSANAAVLFTDGFAADSAGQNKLNFSSFSNWTVSSGAVDLVNQSNPYGIGACAGACVDLAGSPGPGSITTKAINVTAGAPVVVAFTLSGNQRNLSKDGFVASVSFLPPNGGVAGFISGPASFNPGYINMLNGTPYTETVDGDRGYLTYSYTFTTNISGQFFMTFGSSNLDNQNIGPLLGSVLVTDNTRGVPEPATWALMITGFGLAGSALRRRRVVAA